MSTALRSNSPFGEGQGEDWTGNINIANLATATFGAEAVDINLGGRAENLSTPANRYITFNADGGVSGIVAERADVAEALGKQITLDINGEWRAGQPIKLFRGESGWQRAGRCNSPAISPSRCSTARSPSMPPRSRRSARWPAATLPASWILMHAVPSRRSAAASTSPSTASGDGLAIGTAALDNLLQGQTKLTGRVARGENGLVADKLRIFNEQVEIAADGRLATGTADFTFDTSLSDLKLVSEKASGRLVARGTAQGQNGLINLTFNADVPQGSLVGKNLTEGVSPSMAR